MSSIDERIVIIKFDNDQFEQNVAQSQKTLDKLKEKLKLDGASKGLEAVSASAKSFSFGHIGEAVDSLRDRFSTLGVVGLTVIQNLTNKVTDFATKIGGQIVSGGIRRAKNLEQANFMLEGLFGDMENKAEKVQEIMTAANNAVSGTAYGLDEAAKVASQLVASGIQDGEKMEFVLRGIAGTAAMTGGSYEELGNIFTTVAGSGKLMTEQLRQFEHRGLNVAATLAKELGTTEVEIREMVHDGEIDFETFSVALANAFGEHAQEANKTFAGSLSNVKAALSRLGAKVSTPELQNLRDIFNVLAPMIDAVSKALQPLIDLLNNGLRKATNRGVEALTTFFLAFGGDAETLVAKTQYMSDEAKAHMNSTIAKFADVQEAGGNFFTRLRERITGVSEAVTSTADDVAEATDSIGMSVEELDEYANRVISGEFGNGETRREQLEALGLSYEQVQNKVNELLGCEYRYEVATKEAGDATGRTTTEMQKMSLMEKKLSGTTEEMAEEAEYVASPLENLGAGLKNIIGTLKLVGRAIGGAFTSVFSVKDLTDAIAFLADGFRKLTENFKLSEKASSGLATVFTGIFTAARYGFIAIGRLLAIAGKALGLIGRGINALLEHIDTLRGKLATSKTWQNFWASVSAAAESAGQKFQEFKTKVKSAIEQLKNTEGFKRLQEALDRLWGVIKELAGKVFDKLAEKFSKFAGTKGDFSWLDTIVNFLDKAAGKLADFIQSFIDGTDPLHKFFDIFKGENTGKFGKFVEFLTTAKDAIVGFFSGLFGGEDPVGNIAKGGLSQWFKNFFGNLFSGEEGFFESVKNSGFIKAIKDFFKKLWEDAQGVDWDKVAGMVKSIGKAILELAFVIESLRILHHSANALKSAAGMFASIGGFFDGITKNKGLFHSVNAKAQILISFAAVVGTIALSLYGLSKIPAEELAKAIKSISILLGEVAGILVIIGALKLNDSQMKSFGVAMAGLGVGMLLLVGAIKLLAEMDNADFKKGATAVFEIMTVLALAARLAGKSSFGTLVGMALAVDMLVPAIWILGTIKKQKLEQGILAILAVTMELALAARIAGRSSFGTLMGMALAVDLLVPAIWVLGTMDVEKLKQGAIGIGAVMLTLAAAVRIAGSSASAAKAALAMTVPLVAAAISLWALTKIDQEALKNAAIALSGTMLAIAAALRIADGINGPGGIAGFLILLGSLTLAFKILTDMDTSAILQAAEGLALVAVGLAIALKLIAPLGPMIGPAILGIVLYDAFLLDLVGMLALFGAMAQNATFRELISAGAGVFGQLGEALGGFARGIISGIGEGVSSLLSDLGVGLSKFSENAKTFIDDMSGVDSGVVDSVSNLAKAILIIGGADFLESITGGLFGSSSIESFGEKIVSLAGYLKEYSKAISDGDFNASVVESSAKAAEMLATMASAIPNEGGQLAKLIGDNTLTQFANHLAPFGEALVAYSNSISGENIDVEAIKASAKGAAALVDMANEIPNEGGKIAELIGDNTLTQFAKHLKPFGEALADYSDVVTGRNIDAAAIEASADGAAALAKMADAVPNEGGKIAELIGDNTLSQFKEHLKPFAEALADYSDIVSGGAISVSSISNSVTAASEIARMADLIPNEGGLLGDLIGNNNLDTFGDSLSAFGTGIKAYSDSVKDLNTEGITQSATAVGTILGIKTKLAEAGYSSSLYSTSVLSNFGEDLSGFAAPLNTFADAISGMGSAYKFSSVLSYLPSLVDVIKAASDAKVSSSNLSNFATGLTDTGSAISSFSSSVSSVTSYKMQTVAKVVKDDIISMITSMSNAESGNAASYADTLVTIGRKLGTFGDSLSNINTNLISSVSDSVSKIAEIQKQMQTATDAIGGSVSESMGKAAQKGVSAMVEGLKSGATEIGIAVGKIGSKVIEGFSKFPDELNKIGKVAGDSFARGIGTNHLVALNNAKSVGDSAVSGVSSIATRMQAAGSEAGTAFVRGVGTNNYSAWTAANTVAGSAYSGASSGVSSSNFYNLGSNAIQGFINGMNGMYWSVYWAAYYVIKAARDAAMAALNMHSPSKEFYKIGDLTIQGFVNGLYDGRKLIKRASKAIADVAIAETKKPLNALQNAIDLNIDSNPTITPILDLSNIQKGAGLIGSIFNRNSPQLALAGAGAFNGLQAMAANRSIQADNSDVVHAINGLRDSMGNTTFNITVDGSTNPEDFVNDVVRILKNRSRG